jgi:hypothetical protein
MPIYSDVRNRPIAILLLMLFISQMVVMGLYGGRVMCFGSAHDHETQVVTCESGCEHESSKPIVTSHETGHDDGCGCTDVDIKPVELVKTHSDSDSLDGCTGVYATACVLSSINGTQAERTLRTPILISSDSGGAFGLRLVSAARLLL